MKRINEYVQAKIIRLDVGTVERVGYIQPPDTELRRVWGDDVYHYELRPAGYRTQYERELQAEFEAERRVEDGLNVRRIGE